MHQVATDRQPRIENEQRAFERPKECAIYGPAGKLYLRAKDPEQSCERSLATENKVVHIPQAILRVIDAQAGALLRRHAIVGKTVCCVTDRVRKSRFGRVAYLCCPSESVRLEVSFLQNILRQTKPGSRPAEGP